MLGYYKRQFGYIPDDFINAYACDRMSITLPLYVGLTADDQELIVSIIRETIDEM